MSDTPPQTDAMPFEIEIDLTPAKTRVIVDGSDIRTDFIAANPQIKVGTDQRLQVTMTFYPTEVTFTNEHGVVYTFNERGIAIDGDISDVDHVRREGGQG